ncbi:MAG: hypothetical protein HY770_03095 [Chitinivibrionia bacterium]|nr:hypothetical protein [Chitinivibrionia bacterium]
MKVAVFPFAATREIHSDAREAACATMDDLLRSELDKRIDYRFIPTTTVLPALEAAGLEAKVEQWMGKWMDDQEIDGELLDELSQTLQADALLIGVVDQWANTRGGTIPETIVSASITMIELKTGITVFQASDKDCLEGGASETLRYTTLNDQRIPEERVRNQGGSAPPHQIEVAKAIAKSLAGSVPTSNTLKDE